MKKTLITFFAYIVVFTSLGQNDTIQSFHVKIEYDSAENQDRYYERINKEDKNLFFDDNNFKVIKNKIIKQGNVFKHIKNGKLTKTEHYRGSLNTKTTKLRDSIGQIEFVIKCENNRVKEIEKYSYERIIFRGKYGLIDISEEFLYTDDGYILHQKSKGVEIKFSVIVDEMSGEIVSKTKLTDEAEAGIKEDKDGYYFVPDEDFMSKIYSELKSYCSSDNDE